MASAKSSPKSTAKRKAPKAAEGVAIPDGQGAELATSWSPAHLGEMIRAIRTMQGLSMGEVARRSDVSVSFLSLVETGQSDISVGRLLRVAQALGVDPGRFISADPLSQRSRIVDKDDRIELPTGRDDLRIFLLAPSRESSRAYAAGWLRAGSSVDRYTAPARLGESFVFVLEGSLQVDLTSGDSATLEAGASICFVTADVKRMTAGEQSCEFIWAVASIRPSSS